MEQRQMYMDEREYVSADNMKMNMLEFAVLSSRYGTADTVHMGFMDDRC